MPNLRENYLQKKEKPLKRAYKFKC